MVVLGESPESITHWEHIIVNVFYQQQVIIPGSSLKLTSDVQQYHREKAS